MVSVISSDSDCRCFLTVMQSPFYRTTLPSGSVLSVHLLAGNNCLNRTIITDVPWPGCFSPSQRCPVLRNRLRLDTQAEQINSKEDSSVLIKSIWDKSQHIFPMNVSGCKCFSLVQSSSCELWRSRVFPERSAGKRWQELTSTQRGHCAARGSLLRRGYRGHKLFGALGYL